MANVMTKPSVLIPLADSIWNKSIQSCTGLTQSERNLSPSPKIGSCQQAGTSKRFTTSYFCNYKSRTHRSLAERRRAALGYFSFLFEELACSYDVMVLCIPSLTSWAVSLLQRLNLPKAGLLHLYHLLSNPCDPSANLCAGDARAADR